MKNTDFLQKVSERIPPSIRKILFPQKKQNEPGIHSVEIGENNNSLIIDGKPWAVDLTWGIEENIQIDGKSARTKALAENHDLYIINNLTQLGSLESSQEIKEKTPVLCLAIASYINTPNFLIALEVDENHFYIVACENGGFKSYSETVYNLSDAISHFNALLYQYTRQKATIIAPKEWAIDEADEVTFNDIIPHLSKNFTLHGTKPPISKKTIFMGAAAVIVLLGSYKLYTRYKRQQELQKTINEMQAESERQAQAQIQSIPILPPLPSIGQERAYETIKKCYREIPTLPMALPGWKTTGVDCTGQTISVTLAKDPIGTVNWLVPYSKKYRDGKGKVSWSPETPDNASITWDIPEKKEKVWANVDGQNPDRIARYLYSNFSEIYGLDLYSLSLPEKPPVMTTTVGHKPVTIAAPWTVQTLTLKMTGPLRPDILNLTKRLQNAVMTSFHLTKETSSYTITESIYHYDPPQGPAEIIPDKR